MRILYVTSSSNASGGSRQALYLASGMTRRGHEVTFFTPAKSMLRSLKEAENVCFADLPDNARLWKKTLESALPQKSPAVVHSFHNKATKALALMGTWWRITGKPVACVAHRGVIYPPRNPLPYLLPGIQCFAVNSQACLNTLPLLWRKKVGKVVFNAIPKSKITPTRSREEVRSELDITEDTFVVGCVSNNSPVKGVDVLIKGFAAAKLANATLVLVGVTHENWLPLCEECGIANAVRMVSRTENVADYLNAYDLFVLPSRSESSPNTLLEAMCMGLPAIGSKVGGVPECLEDEALLFPSGDYAQLAEKMRIFYSDPTARQTAAVHNQQFSWHFSLRTKLEAMENIYKTLLSEKRSA